MPPTTPADNSQPNQSQKSKSEIESEPRYSRLTEEQKTRLARELVRIQRQQKELGLEEKGPALG